MSDAPSPLTSGTPEIRLALRAEPTSVGRARAAVRDALTAWGYAPGLVHDAMVVASEIVTNAVAAAPGQGIRLRCAVYCGAPLLECWDPSPVLPVACSADELSETGRGLAIVAAYADEGGVRVSPGSQGKVVWALMPA